MSQAQPRRTWRLYASTTLLIPLTQQAMCGGGSTGGPTADDLLAITETCSQLPGSSKFKNDSSSSSATIPVCELNGAVWWEADMDIDCDGGTETNCTKDPYYQSETAVVDSNGDPLDASNLPFIVLPLASNGFDYAAEGIYKGAAGAVIYNGILQYGVFGDLGPKGVIGEASYAMAAELGINPDPISGGTPSGVTYIVFTGSDAKVDPVESESQAEVVGSQQATDLLNEN